MAQNDSENHPLLYSLCALAAGAAILNAVFLLWQFLKLRKPKGFSFVKYSLLLLDTFYSLTAVALVLLILYRDVGGSSLCDAGGYLVLAGSQLALWFQATACIALLLWIRKSLSPDLQRRNGPIFALIACSQCLVIAIISALPYMNLPYFDNTGDFYFTCTPLKLPGDQGWAYSALLLILDWISVAISAGALIKISIHCSSCRQPSVSAAEKLEEFHVDGSKLRQQRQSFLTLTVCLFGWVAVLVIANITYFSSGKLDHDAGQWILGFCLSITLCLRPLFNVGHQLISRWLTRNGRDLRTVTGALFQARPSGLQRLARLPDSHQTPLVQKYLVQWRDKKGQLLSGTLKTFVPTAQGMWRGEVNALERLGAGEEHPNLGGYLWLAPNNPFTQSICSNTGDPVSRHAGVTCRVHFPNGTLSDFLRTRIHQLSEQSLHKIALDVANGLEFLHQRNIVHNGLNSNAVFMASVSEKSGVRAVVADLENSYVVSDDTDIPEHLYKTKRTWDECDTTELFTISSRMALQQDSGQNKFAPDIRAFGLLVLEMLVAMSQYKQKIQSAPRSRVSRLLEEVVRDATANDLPVDTSTPYEYHLHDDENCLCSNRVVDVRVHSEASESQEIIKQDHEVLSRNNAEEASLIPKHNIDIHTDVDMCAQNDGAEMCLTCGYNFDGTEDRAVHTCLDSPTSQCTEHEEEDLCRSCQDHEMGLRVDSVAHYRLTEKEGGSSTPPKLSVRAFNIDKTSKIPKSRNPDHVIELPEIGESDTESVASIYRPYARRGSYSGKQILTNGSFLTPRTTPELRTPTSRSDSSATTPTSLTYELKTPTLSQGEAVTIEAGENSPGLKDVESRQDTPLSIKVQEIGFQTIYEEDENQTNTLPKNQPKPHVPPKPRKLFKPPALVKRRPPPPLPRGEGATAGQTDVSGRKRFSMASLDESVVSSADSGLGSSHYEGSYCGSEISSIYQPGSRNTIYSGSETYCPVKTMSQKLNTSVRNMDSGIESSADSYDELSTKLKSGHLQQNSDPLSSEGSMKENTSTNTPDEDQNDEDSVNNTYEQLPDLPDTPAILPRRKEKQPCVGHHDHLGNSPCKHHHKPVPTTSSSASKTAVTISTQTTGSLERQNGERRKSADGVEESLKLDKTDTISEPNYPTSPKKEISSKVLNSQNIQSVQSQTVRLKTHVHHETVHSQPVHTQTAAYPQKLQPPHLPPKQIYTQSQAQHFYHEIGPGAFNTNYGNTSSDNYSDFGSVTHEPEFSRKDFAEVHSTYLEPKRNSYGSHQISPEKRIPPVGTHPTPWSDYRHNLAYYKSDLDNYEAKVPDTHRSAFRKPPASKLPVYDHFVNTYGAGAQQTDEEKLSQVLDKLRKEGRLGYVAGQLMPLLTECYSQNPSQSTDDILHKLEQVLPSATV